MFVGRYDPERHHLRVSPCMQIKKPPTRWVVAVGYVLWKLRAYATRETNNENTHGSKAHCGLRGACEFKIALVAKHYGERCYQPL